MSRTVTRFAPSPTGLMHLGHAHAALFAAARATGGAFLLRIEDIDAGRCREEFETAIYDDLTWLGLSWAQPVRRQSDHLADYAAALDELDAMELLYPCFCTRKDIQREIDEAGRAPHVGPDGPLYPGLCRNLTAQQRDEWEQAGRPYALRLRMDEAVVRAGNLTWRDASQGEQTATPQMFGDVVLARKDTPTSYHLSVTVDDHIQGVSRVTRGEDLFAATHVHRLLQFLLGLNTPAYDHHRLLLGEDGKRLAKRDKPLTLRALREVGKSPEEVRVMAGF